MEIPKEIASVMVDVQQEINDDGRAVSEIVERVTKAVFGSGNRARLPTRVELLNAIVALSTSLATIEALAPRAAGLSSVEIIAARCVGRCIVEAAVSEERVEAREAANTIDVVPDGVRSSDGAPARRAG